MYGIAEASTAYLVTKITSPPPPPEAADEFRQKDVRWENKHEFLNLPLEALDKLNIKVRTGSDGRLDEAGEIPGKKFS